MEWLEVERSMVAGEHCEGNIVDGTGDEAGAATDEEMEEEGDRFEPGEATESCCEEVTMVEGSAG